MKFWCVDCIRPCPGLDKDGFCILANRERLRRPTPPAPVKESLHRHNPDFAQWQVYVNGEAIEHVWWACVRNEFRGGAGSVQVCLPGEPTSRYLVGRVEIRPVSPAPVAAIALAAPVTIPLPAPKASTAAPAVTASRGPRSRRDPAAQLGFLDALEF